MSKRRPDGGGDDLADDATDASSKAWERFDEKAEDEKRSGERDPQDDGISMFPDVQLLADHLSATGDEVADDDDEWKDGGAP